LSDLRNRSIAQHYRWIDKQRTSWWIAQQSADRACAVIRARQLSVVSANKGINLALSMLAISVTVHSKITAAAATFGVNSGVTPEI